MSREPERGAAPRYVKTVPEGLKGWSASAIAVAEYLVRNSECGGEMDPQANVAAVCAATGCLKRMSSWACLTSPRPDS